MTGVGLGYDSVVKQRGRICLFLRGKWEGSDYVETP